MILIYIITLRCLYTEYGENFADFYLSEGLFFIIFTLTHNSAYKTGKDRIIVLYWNVHEDIPPVSN